MAHETRVLAPWAEPVWTAKIPLTSEALLTVPDDGYQYELVEGRLVRMTPSAGGDSARAARLVIALGAYVQQHGLGEITGADGGFLLSVPGSPTTVLAPDIGFVRTGRAPRPGTPEYDRFWEVAPDLAVEVASGQQSRPELAAKARFYLRAGVRMLWLIWPKYRLVEVWRQGSEDPVAELHDTEQLDGLDVVPGFTYPVTNLF